MAVRDEMVWRPIETAPNDGTYYLIADDRHYDVGNQPRGRTFGRWTKERGKWFGYAKINSWATHWMPLPKLPKE